MAHEASSTFLRLYNHRRKLVLAGLQLECNTAPPQKNQKEKSALHIPVLGSDLPLHVPGEDNPVI